MARIGIVRSVIFSIQDRYDEAIATARDSARAFRAVGDWKLLAAGLNAEAFALMIAARYREALPILLDVNEHYCDFLNPVDRAGLFGNLALCYWNTGRVAEALQNYELAAADHAAIGAVAEVARIDFNVAGLLASEGRHEEAKPRLRRVREDFQRLGMHGEMVSADLILAEILLAEQAYDEVVDLCTRCMEHYRRTGMTVDGLTALSYLKEAAARRNVTPDAVRQVRRYFERLSSQPELLFAPPPLPPS